MNENEIREQDFWEEAARKGLPRFRFFRQSLAIDQIEKQFLGSRIESDWLRLKAKLQPGDKLWPFEFEVRSCLGLRRGYIAIRRAKPIGGVITVLS